MVILTGLIALAAGAVLLAFGSRRRGQEITIGATARTLRRLPTIQRERGGLLFRPFHFLWSISMIRCDSCDIDLNTDPWWSVAERSVVKVAPVAACTAHTKDNSRHRAAATATPWFPTCYSGQSTRPRRSRDHPERVLADSRSSTFVTQFTAMEFTSLLTCVENRGAGTACFAGFWAWVI